jgi:hypothetical protein
MTKVCKKCGQVKEETAFPFYDKAKGRRQGACHMCLAVQARQYWDAHKKRLAANRKRWAQENHDRCLENQRKRRLGDDAYKEYLHAYYRENKERLTAQNKEYVQQHREQLSEYQQRWREDNRERLLEDKRKWDRENRDRLKPQRRNAERVRWESEPRYRLSKLIAHRMRLSLQEGKQGRHWETLVGYTVLDLKAHIESLFLPGMTWDNYGNWHIDHIKPIAAFTFSSSEDAAFQECWALSNLRPLWATDNLKKGAKWKEELSCV